MPYQPTAAAPRRFDSRNDSLAGDARARGARKRLQLLAVRFAQRDEIIETIEGAVPVAAGDAIVTGPASEQWPVTRDRFAAKYQPVAPCRSFEDGVYQSLPVPVRALQVAAPFEVLLADGVTRLHGQGGDWVIDYGDGSLGVVAQALFPILYELDSPIPYPQGGAS
ncbi:MAG: hypothetical protein JWR56_2699 [Massilia sp.]|nr:hypothetical protein [Massilia sp.]